MRIGIEARLAYAAAEHTGFQYYLFGLLAGLVAGGADDTVLLYYRGIPAGWRGPTLPRTRTVRPRRIRIPLGWLTFGLPWALLRDRVRCVLFPYAVLPRVLPVPAVTVFHDLTFETHPEWYTAEQLRNAVGPHRDALRRSRHFIVPSECTRTDMQQFFDVAPERISAIPHAAGAAFRPDAQVAARVRARYGLPARYFLTVGTIQPRKNLETLITALAEVREAVPDAHLVIAGPRGWKSEGVFQRIEALGVGDAVTVLGYVPADDLPGLYTGATALAFPSWYEGFGLPVLEAMACGCPVLCSDCGSLPEVAGGAAWVLPADAPEAWTAALREVLTDADRRAHFTAAGRARAARFSWEETARRTLAVLRQVGASG